jgi:hypothetical protein
MDLTGLSNAFREQVAMAGVTLSWATRAEDNAGIVVMGRPAVFFIGGVGYFLVHATHQHRIDQEEAARAGKPAGLFLSVEPAAGGNANPLPQKKSVSLRLAGCYFFPVLF